MRDEQGVRFGLLDDLAHPERLGEFFRWLLAVVGFGVMVLLAGASAALGQGSPAHHPTLVAATWCPVIGGKPEDDAPSCDAGLGLSLWRSTRWPRLGVAAGVGMQTVGAGVSWTVNPAGDRPLAVILGAIAPHDERGIYLDRWAVALGATFSFGGQR